MQDMTRHDALRIRTLIERHRQFTASTRAQEILEDWDNYLPRFVKVMPVEYRAALEKMQAASLPDGIAGEMLNVGT
jgi:glutamate synthase (NADPH/NADH) large chain